jgi:O-acetyl-ADP-ribose deacetylase
MNPAGRLAVIDADITRLNVQAIVNAANSSLLGGGGVDGAIHRAAGPGLLEECRKLGGCPTGQVRLTGGHNLPARYVIHAVGPVWRGGAHNEAQLLADCYRNALALAAQRQMESIAFPAISTGAYGFPLSQAAAIAVKQTHEFVLGNPLPHRVIFCCFGAEAARIFAAEIAVVGGASPSR